MRFSKHQLEGSKIAEQLKDQGIFQDSLFGDKQLSRNEKLKKSRKVTTDLTREVIQWLNATQEFIVWRNNNIPSTRVAKEKVWMNGVDKNSKSHYVEVEVTKIYYKKGQKEVSTLDIIGYRKSDGKHLEIEVKTGKDTLDDGQETHIKNMRKSGAISFVFGSFYEFEVQIKPYMQERKLAF